MTDFVMPLMLALDISSLTMSLVNIPSPRRGTGALADSVEAALRPLPHLDVHRDGDTVIASTSAGHAERVVVACHLDTLSSDDSMAYVEMGKLFGPGASGAKGALAMSLKAAALGGYSRDVTFVYSAHGWDEPVSGDFALLAEPTDCAVVGGALDHPLAQRLIELAEPDPVTGRPSTSMGIPTVAFGPGDPSLAGTPGEFVPTAQLAQCEFVLRQWLTT